MSMNEFIWLMNLTQQRFRMVFVVVVVFFIAMYQVFMCCLPHRTQQETHYFNCKHALRAQNKIEIVYDYFFFYIFVSSDSHFFFSSYSTVAMSKQLISAWFPYNAYIQYFDWLSSGCEWPQISMLNVLKSLNQRRW